MSKPIHIYMSKNIFTEDHANRSNQAKKEKKGKKRKGLESDGDGDHSLAHSAAASGDVPLLIQAIQRDPGVLQQRDEEGYTPLAHAVHGKHINAVKRLVKMGADVNAQDSQGRTYLSIAAYQGWYDGVVYLLRKGAKKSIVDKSGRTPLHASTYDTDTRSLAALLKRLPQDEVNVTDSEKMTALHWAAFHGRPDHVRLLLQSGALSSAQDVDGKTPLHWSAQNGCAKCCALLAEHDLECVGAIKTLDNCGKTALHLASAAGKPKVIQELAHFAPEMCEAEDQDDRTPLHWATAMGHSDCVKVLLQLKVTSSPLDVDGVTPLEYAKHGNHKECVSLIENYEKNRLNNNTHMTSNSGTTGRSLELKSSSSSLFKGLFHKKEKQSEASYVIDRLPSVSVNGDKEKTKRKHTDAKDSDSVIRKHADTKDSGSVVLVGNDRTVDTERGRISHSEDRLKDDGGLYGNSEQSDDRYDQYSDKNNEHSNYSSNRDPGELKDRLSVADTTLEVSSGRHSGHHRKKRKKRKRRTDQSPPRPTSPDTVKSISTWANESANDYPSSRIPRSMHLSPLGNLRPPSISPRVSDQTDDTIYRRVGELSPIRGTRHPNGHVDVPIPHILTSIKQETSPRSPTPPPYLVINMNPKATLPEISPLAHGVETLDIERKERKKKKHRDRSRSDRSPTPSPSPYRTTSRPTENTEVIRHSSPYPEPYENIKYGATDVHNYSTFVNNE